MPLINPKAIRQELAEITQHIRFGTDIGAHNHYNIKVLLLVLTLYIRVISGNVFQTTLCFVVCAMTYILLLVEIHKPNGFRYILDTLCFEAEMLCIPNRLFGDTWMVLQILKAFSQHMFVNTPPNRTAQEQQQPSLQIMHLFTIPSLGWIFAEVMYVTVSNYRDQDNDPESLSMSY